MKKLAITAWMLALAWQATSQNINNSTELNLNADFKKHELKVDAAWLLGAAVKADYEYFLNDWSSIGASAFYNFSRDAAFRMQALGTYRMYFGNEPQQGFFLEGNVGMIVNGTDSYYYGSYGTETVIGAGLALGWKWYIPKSRVVLDLYGGIGRALGASEAYLRAGIAIGKRF